MSPANSLSSSIKVSKLLYKTTFFVFIESSAKGPIYHDGYIRTYIPLARKRFLNAKIVLDRFHIVQHLSRAMNRLRIQIMNQLDRKSHEYKALKRYWKLIQQDSSKLSDRRFYRPTFRSHLTNKEILEKLLSYSQELRKHYDLLQADTYIMAVINN